MENLSDEQIVRATLSRTVAMVVLKERNETAAGLKKQKNMEDLTDEQIVRATLSRTVAMVVLQERNETAVGLKKATYAVENKLGKKRKIYEFDEGCNKQKRRTADT